MWRGSIAAVWALLLLAATAQAQQVLYVGDSLGVGTTPGLTRELGASARVHGDSRIGRPSGEGLQVLTRMVSPADDIVVFDLGTNDDPAQPARLASDLAAARRATGNDCLIVATLNRPPLNGVSVDGLNQAVIAFASSAKNVQLVDWNAIASSQPRLLGPDHVHPTPQGYALRAQLFGEAVSQCSRPGPSGDQQATPAPKPKTTVRRKPKPKPAIKVPGIESSGISFTEPLSVRGQPAQLLLPNTKPPYPAIVMLGATQPAAEFLAAHGIAALTMHGSAADARAAVDLLRRRKEIRRDGVGLWALGGAAPQAAAAAASDRNVAAVVVISPTVLSKAELLDWQARRSADDPPVSTWVRLKAENDTALRMNPAAAWRAVNQPVLAVWGTRDDRMPIRASGAALNAALAANDDRTFRWFNAAHAVDAPGFLEESARWLGLHLGAKRAQPVVRAELPPANPGPEPEDVATSSALYTPIVQLLWLLVPALMLGIAALGARRLGERGSPATLLRWIAIATIACVACFGLIAFGAATIVDAPSDSIARVAGMAWPFALAVVAAAALAVTAVALARRHAWLAAAGTALWLGLALFWLV